MGRRDRERIERIRAGLEDPIRHQQIRESSYKGMVKELSKGNVTKQTDRLSELVGTGTVPENKLRHEIMRNAPAEMDKAIRKFQKKGKEITVESLTADIRKESSFLRMCERVGIDITWFEKLAQIRMEVQGL